jgi:GT2 family glycosyltransferase
VTVSAVIPNLNSGLLLDRCLDALAPEDIVEEVLVVDAGSDDGSDERAASRERVRVISAPGTSIQARLNLSLEQARNEYVLLLNSDAFVDARTPVKLAEVLDERPDIAASGALLRFEDGSPQKSGDRYKTLLWETLALLPGGRTLRRRVMGPGLPVPKPDGIVSVTWLPLCCAVVRRSAGREIGGWDERFTFFYEDQDFCRRLAEAGWGLAIRSDAGAIHVGGGSTSTWKAREPSEWFVRLQENRILYLQKWHPRAWRVFAVVWRGRAWLHVVLWRARAVRSRLRADRDGVRRAEAWARVFRRAARP